MKITVLGGTGLIGSKLIPLLKSAGHNVVAASMSTGVNVLTGQGIKAAVDGADVVVDVLNSPSFEEKAVNEFFVKATNNILPVVKANGLKHYVMLSVVGCDVMPNIGYMKAKVVQETALKKADVPYTIVRATQFFEFMGAIVDGFTKPDGVCRASSVMIQPIAAKDVATALADVVESSPRNGVVDLSGPEAGTMLEIVKKYLNLKGDTRPTEFDEKAGYYGGQVDEKSLIPVGSHGEPVIGTTHMKEWMATSK